MKAIVQDRYGSAETLEYREAEMPTPGDNQVLVKVKASSINAADWFALNGTPLIMRPIFGMRRPRHGVPGLDVAGTVESAGSKVTEFKVGDEVFGQATGAYAEYACAKEKNLIIKPAGISFEQAAALPLAGLAALDGIRTAGKVEPGQKVLINGASGGVGTFAVQIAKALGAEVTGVCSTRNVDMVRSLGADHVVDYTKDDVTKQGVTFDLIIDNAASHPLSEMRTLLAPRGRLIPNNGSKGGRWLGPMPRIIGASITSLFVRHKLGSYLSTLSKDKLNDLVELMETGKLEPVIEKTYPLSDTAAAMRHFGEEHAKGKIVVKV